MVWNNLFFTHKCINFLIFDMHWIALYKEFSWNKSKEIPILRLHNFSVLQFLNRQTHSKFTYHATILFVCVTPYSNLELITTFQNDAENGSFSKSSFENLPTVRRVFAIPQYSALKCIKFVIKYHFKIICEKSLFFKINQIQMISAKKRFGDLPCMNLDSTSRKIIWSSFNNVFENNLVKVFILQGESLIFIQIMKVMTILYFIHTNSFMIAHCLSARYSFSWFNWLNCA